MKTENMRGWKTWVLAVVSLVLVIAISISTSRGRDVRQGLQRPPAGASGAETQITPAYARADADVLDLQLD